MVESSARRDVLVRSPRAAELAELIAQRGGTVTRQDDGALVVTGLDAAAIADVKAAETTHVAYANDKLVVKATNAP